MSRSELENILEKRKQADLVAREKAQAVENAKRAKQKTLEDPKRRFPGRIGEFLENESLYYRYRETVKTTWSLLEEKFKEQGIDLSRIFGFYPNSIDLYGLSYQVYQKNIFGIEKELSSDSKTVTYSKIIIHLSLPFSEIHENTLSTYQKYAWKQRESHPKSYTRGVGRRFVIPLVIITCDTLTDPGADYLIQLLQSYANNPTSFISKYYEQIQPAKFYSDTDETVYGGEGSMEQ